MFDFETKYSEEKKKYENLLRMQKTILADTDEYISAFSSIKQTLSLNEGTEFDPSEEITPEEAHSIAITVTQLLKETHKKCQCDRWKSLYQQEAKESTRTSRQKEQLINKLAHIEKEEQADRMEINKLLQDYLQLYRKEVIGEKGPKKSEKKEKRSRSKGNAQTERKGGDNTKEESQVSWVLAKMQRDCGDLQKQLQLVRKEVLEKEKLLSLYRIKERRHLLAGGELLD